MGQFVGVSSNHASSVGLIRHLRTNNISPKFHVVYDDFFETVHSSEETAPAVWDELIIFGRHRANYDDDNVPDLSKEWLDPIEQAERKEEEDIRHRPK